MQVVKTNDIYISSSDRKQDNSNILSAVKYYLSPNPVQVVQGSSLIKLSMQPNHVLIKDDKVILENVTGELVSDIFEMSISPQYISIDCIKYIDTIKTSQLRRVKLFITGSLYIFNSIPTISINADDHDVSFIDNRYLVVYVTNLNLFVKNTIRIYIQMIFYNTVDSQENLIINDYFDCSLQYSFLKINIRDNAKYNTFVKNTCFQMRFLTTASDYIYNTIRFDFFEKKTLNISIIDDNFLIIPLNRINVSNLTVLTHDILFLFQDIYGIRTSKINANNPVDEYHEKWFHTIVEASANSILIDVGENARYSVENVGGNNVLVQKIAFQEVGSKINSYKINLFNTFTNVVSLSLKSLCFPSAFRLLSSSKYSNTISFFDTQNTKYDILLNDNILYDITSLLGELKKGFEKLTISSNSDALETFVMTYNIENNYFFSMQIFTQRVVVEPFTIPSSANTASVTISNNVLNTLEVRVPNHNLTDENEIILENAISFKGIPASALNKTHTISVKDKDTLIIYLDNYNIDTASIGNNNLGGKYVSFKVKKNIAVHRTYLSTLLRIPLNTYSDTFRNTIPLQLYPRFMYLCASVNNGENSNSNIYTRHGISDILCKIYIPSVSAANHTFENIISFPDSSSTGLSELKFDPPLSYLYSVNFSIRDENMELIDFFDDCNHDFVISVTFIDHD